MDVWVTIGEVHRALRAQRRNPACYEVISVAIARSLRRVGGLVRFSSAILWLESGDSIVKPHDENPTLQAEPRDLTPNEPGASSHLPAGARRCSSSKELSCTVT